MTPYRTVRRWPHGGGYTEQEAGGPPDHIPDPPRRPALAWRPSWVPGHVVAHYHRPGDAGPVACLIRLDGWEVRTESGRELARGSEVGPAAVDAARAALAAVGHVLPDVGPAMGYLLAVAVDDVLATLAG